MLEMHKLKQTYLNFFYQTNKIHPEQYKLKIIPPNTLKLCKHSSTTSYPLPEKLHTRYVLFSLILIYPPPQTNNTTNATYVPTVSTYPRMVSYESVSNHTMDTFHLSCVFRLFQLVSRQWCYYRGIGLVFDPDDEIVVVV